MPIPLGPLPRGLRADRLLSPTPQPPHKGRFFSFRKSGLKSAGSCDFPHPGPLPAASFRFNLRQMAGRGRNIKEFEKRSFSNSLMNSPLPAEKGQFE